MKRAFIYFYNYSCLFMVTAVVSAQICYLAESDIIYTTSPCFFQYTLKLMMSLCATAFFALCALPAAAKVNAKHLQVKKVIEGLFITNACLGAVDFLFLIRTEYLVMFDWSFINIKKLLLLAFYLFLFFFFKTNSYALRMSGILAGAAYIVYTLVYDLEGYEIGVNVPEVCNLGCVGLFVLMLLAFVSPERAVFADVVSKTDLYVVGRYVAANGKRYAIVKSERLHEYAVYNDANETIAMANVFNRYPYLFGSRRSCDEFYAELKRNKHLDKRNHKNLI